MMKRHVTLAVVVLLGGCTMIPGYDRPPAPVPAEWPVSAGAANAAPEALPAWREVFTDQKLQQVIETALRENRDLRTAALNVQRARSMYHIQLAGLLPTVNGSGSGSRQQVSADLVSPDSSRKVEQYSAAAGIASWEIDLFGRIQSLSEAELERYFATAEARRSTQIALISEVVNAYLTLAADRENLRLSQLTLESQQAACSLIQRRFELGLAPELDLHQVQTRVESARVDVSRFTQVVAQDENALNLLAGSTVPPELLPESLAAIAPLREVQPNLPSEVLLNRPDVLEAEHQLKAAYANIGAARAALFPRISLTTSIGTASDELSGLFRTGTDAWLFAPQVDIPIFDSRAWLALGVTELDQQIARSQYEKAVQGAFREVADALAQHANLGHQLEAQQALTDASDAAYRLSYARYTKGIDIFLNALDAQRSLYSAQQGLISVRLAKLANQAQMYAVLGGGGEMDSNVSSAAPETAAR